MLDPVAFRRFLDYSRPMLVEKGLDPLDRETRIALSLANAKARTVTDFVVAIKRLETFRDEGLHI